MTKLGRWAGLMGAVVAVTAAGGAAFAQEATEVDQLVITGRRAADYRVDDSAVATRTDAPVLETPFSITAVPRSLNLDRGVQSAADALALVPSVNQRQSYQGYQAFTVRGFFQDTETGFQIDGLRTRNVVSFDPFLFESVEVLKGPASLLYGTVEPGGVVNFTTARPTAEPFGFVGVEGGRFDDYRLTLDGSAGLGEGLAVRAPVVARRHDGFRDFIEDNEYLGAAPSLDARLGSDTDLRLALVYVDQDAADDTILIPVFDGRPLPLPDERFLGVPGARQQDRLVQALASLEHRFSPSLRWTNAVSIYDHEQDSDQVSNVFGVDPDGRTLSSNLRVRGRNGGSNLQARSEIVAELGAHRLLAGLEAQRSTVAFNNDDVLLSPIDAFAPVYEQTVVAEGFIFDGVTERRETDQRAVYVQDQATLLKNRPGVHKLIVVAGVRFDQFEQDVVAGGVFFGTPAANRFTIEEEGVSPQLGVVWMPEPRVSLYGSYARSLSPQFTSFNYAGDTPTEPQESAQYELGLKVEPVRTLRATAAVFDILKENVPGPSAIPGVTGLDQSERSRGVELEVAGELRPGWQVFGGVAYIEAKVEEATDGSEGNDLFNAPRERVSFYTSYTAPAGRFAGLGGGAGVAYTGKSFAENFEFTRLDAYTLVDAALWWRPETAGPVRPSFQIGVRNLTDERYYLGGNGFNSVQPGAPRVWYASVGARF